jgi:hypothetical protein
MADLKANAATVKLLLDAAQVSVSEEEFLTCTRMYAAHRAQADALHALALGEEATALTFDPAAAYA